MFEGLRVKGVAATGACDDVIGDVWGGSGGIRFEEREER